MARIFLVAASFAFVIVCSTPASAIPPKGKFSLSAGFPDGGDPYTGGAGVWWMVAKRINLGLSIAFDYNMDGDQNPFTFGPAMRYYLNAASLVAPFVYAQLPMFFETDDGQDLTVGAILGFGCEWFINRSVSISVYTGLRIDLVGGGDKNITTTTSGLAAQFYF